MRVAWTQVPLSRTSEPSRDLVHPPGHRPRGKVVWPALGPPFDPMRYGAQGDDCPTAARPDPDSAIQAQLAMGSLYETPTLFDLEPERPSKIVWLLQTGDHAESGPLSAYVALQAGPCGAATGTLEQA